MVDIRCNRQLFTNIEAIVFDKDGTLADAIPYLRTLAQRRLRLLDAQVPGVGEPLQLAFGLERDWLNPAGLMAVGSRRQNEIAAAAYVAETGRSWAECLAMVEAAFREADLSAKEKAGMTPPLPGCREMLQSLAQAGIKIAIASADTLANIQAFVCQYELTSQVEAIVGADSRLPQKPDPEIVAFICQRLGTAATTTLVVGDSELDLQMAKQAHAAGAIGVLGNHLQPIHLPSADGYLQFVKQLKIES